MSDDSKLTEVFPFRLAAGTVERIQAAAKRRGIKRPEYMRQAIAAQLERDEAEVVRPVVTPEQAALLELCETAAKRGIDPRAALSAALESSLEAEAKAVA